MRQRQPFSSRGGQPATRRSISFDDPPMGSMKKHIFSPEASFSNLFPLLSLETRTRKGSHDLPRKSRLHMPTCSRPSGQHVGEPSIPSAWVIHRTVSSIPLLPLLRLRAATSTPSTSPSTTCTPTRLPRRWPHEGKVHLHRLIEQLGIVRAINRSASLLERRVLNKRVSLVPHQLYAPPPRAMPGRR